MLMCMAFKGWGGFCIAASGRGDHHRPEPKRLPGSADRVEISFLFFGRRARPVGHHPQRPPPRDGQHGGDGGL